MSSNPVLVQASRAGAVESFHCGAFAVVDADGGVVRSSGDIERPIFPRSAIKVLQALPLVSSGAAGRLSLTDAELALACASHSGEADHVRTAAAMLAKAGVDVATLECGVQWPRGEATIHAMGRDGLMPTALHNNCSGKHAGFVCLGCMRADGRDVADFMRGYIQPEHPVMREVTASIQHCTGYDLSQAARGVDGCSIPTYAIPLRHLAQAFARIGSGVGLDPDAARAARRLRQAVARAPFMVGGSGRFDTRLMERLGERLFCKVGAEGVYCAALPELGLGVAIKMDDGNTARAAEVAMAALIEALLPLNSADAEFVRGFSNVMLKNWNGIEVGRLRAAPAISADA